MNKKDLRQKIKENLSALDKQIQIDKSLSISKNLKILISKLYSNHSFTGYVGAYAPIGHEVIWHLDFKEDEYCFALPHMLEDGNMDYYPINFQDIEQKKIGLKLDENKRQQVIIPDVLIIPGLGFSKKGQRLGRGKGYFDRYLANFKGPKVGVCFIEQIYEQIPVDEYDVDLDYLITENNIFEK